MDEVYQAIALSSSGFVEAPAGCGKTEAIVKAVGSYCEHRQLILTHTHAGVDALRQRFKAHQIPTSKYQIDTIAGWAWGWVKRYPDNSNYTGSTDIAEWNNVYSAMSNLLQKNFVQQVVLNTYAGIIVDEYQDCTIPMHQLITQLKMILPCRILGDPLQAIFGFRDDTLIEWSDVEGEFTNNLGALDTPHRWIKAGNEPLGRWLLGTRPAFFKNREPDFNGAPISRMRLGYNELSRQLIGLTHSKQGRICIIGPKSHTLPTGAVTALVNQKYKVLESNELSVLKDFIQNFVEGTENTKKNAISNFLKKSYSGLSGEKNFIEKLINGTTQNPRHTNRKSLCETRQSGITPALILDLLSYIEDAGISCKLKESVSALKCVLEEHITTTQSLSNLYADEIGKRKHQSRNSSFRCIGSTLLIKGLEFDHAVIIRGSNWGTNKDLYVALTRGSKSVTLIDAA